MPRKPRGTVNAKFFHVMTQGINREFIFSDDNCKGYYLKCIKNAKERAKVKLLAFCIMSNHAHLLLSAKSILELSLFMNFTNAAYASYYNRVNRRIGYVFRDRFKSEVIRNANQLLFCLAYIHNNPLKAGLVKMAEDYKFSSYNNYLNRAGIIDWDEAKSNYDISPSNIKTIMLHATSSIWLEHDERNYDNPENVLKKFILNKKTSLEDLSVKKPLLIEVAHLLKSTCNLSLREISLLININRERLRKILSTPPSP